MTETSLAEILRANPWFARLDEPQFQKLVSIAQVISWPVGEIAVREGKKGDYLYLVLEGQVALDIHIPSRGHITILTVGPNEIFNWSSVLPVIKIATATARITQPTKVVAFNSTRLQELCEEDHELGFHLYRRLTNVIAGRLTATRLQLIDMYAYQEKDEPR
jgi:CRP-like cAMP-binding protein